MQKQFVTYKFYNKEGKRLAIFCHKPEQTSPHIDNTWVITVIECSRKDSFDKVKANELFNDLIEYGYKLMRGEKLEKTVQIPSWDTSKQLLTSKQKVVSLIAPKAEQFIMVWEENPKKNFLEWCRENYGRRIEYTTKAYVICGPGYQIDLPLVIKRKTIKY